MRYILLIGLLLTIFNTQAQTVNWQKYIPGVTWAWETSMAQDGNIIGCGFKWFTGTSNVLEVQRSFYFKYDINGNEIWKRQGRKIIHGDTFIREKPDGNFIITGGQLNPDSTLQALDDNGSDVYIMSMSANGDTTSNHWAQRFIEPSPLEFPTDLVIMKNGDLLISSSDNDNVRFTITDSTGIQSIDLRRTDSLGNTIWQKEFDAGNFSYPGNIAITKSGNILVSGIFALTGMDVWKLRLILVNPSGDTLITKKLSIKGPSFSSDHQDKNQLLTTPDNGFSLSGIASDTSVNGISHGYLLKLDSLLNVEWIYFSDSSATNSSVYYQHIQLKDSSFLVVEHEIYALSPFKHSLIHISKNGLFLSKTAIPITLCNQYGSKLMSLTMLPDSSIIFSGTCYIPFSQRAMLARVSFASILESEKQLTQAKCGVSVFPNPTTSSLTFTYPTFQHSARLTLTDALGRTVFQKTLPQGSTQHTANLSQLPEAVYFYQLAAENGSIGSGKVAVAR